MANGYNNNGGNNFPAKVWTMWDIDQLILRGNPWDSNNPKEFPKMSLAMTKQAMLIIKVYMNRPGEKGGALRLPIPLFELSVIDQLFDLLKQTTGPGKFTYTLKSNFGPGGYSETPIVVGKLTVGKDVDGVMYFGVNNGPGKPPAIFQFKDNFMASLVNEAGEPLELAVLSPMKAKAWVIDMIKIKDAWMVANAEEKKAKEQKSGGGYGGNNGGYTQPAGNGTFTDDLPY